MTLIACTTGTHAAYVCNGTTTYVPVEAWDLDGNPIVAGDRGLIDASEVRGLGIFAFLETGAAVAKVLAPAPVSSWYEGDEDDEDEIDDPGMPAKAPAPGSWPTALPGSTRRRRPLHIAA